MKLLANIEKEEVLEIEKIFGRLNSLHNLSVTLAANNMLFEEKSDFYAKVIKDLEETQQKYDAWWQKIVSNYNLTSYDVQNLSVNFRTQDIELLN